MSDFINQLNKVFDSRVRLGIMSLLMVNKQVTFKEMKTTLSTDSEPITDGNLASHLKRLRAEEYVEEEKKFVGRKPQTAYFATKEGRRAFKDHLDGLAKMLEGLE